MTPAQQRKQRNLVRAIERYVLARIADNEKGGGDPQSYPEIEMELKKSKEVLTKILLTVE